MGWGSGRLLDTDRTGQEYGLCLFHFNCGTVLRLIFPQWVAFLPSDFWMITVARTPGKRKQFGLGVLEGL